MLKSGLGKLKHLFNFKMGLNKVNEPSSSKCINKTQWKGLI